MIIIVLLAAQLSIESTGLVVRSQQALQLLQQQPLNGSIAYEYEKNAYPPAMAKLLVSAPSLLNSLNTDIDILPVLKDGDSLARYPGIIADYLLDG